MLKCFDNELNPVPSPTTSPTDTFVDGHCRRRSRFAYECSASSNSQSDDGTRFTLCPENKSRHNTNNNCRAILHLSAVKQRNLEAGNYRKTPSATCSMVSSSAEPRTDVASLDDDDVSWFFEDASDTAAGCDQQVVGDVLPVLSAVDKVADIGLQSADKRCIVMPQTCSRLPLTKDVQTFDALDAHNEGNFLLNLDQHMTESLVISNCQNFPYCSASGADNYTYVRSLSAQHSREIVHNTVKTNSDKHVLLPAQQPQKTDKESTPTQLEGLQFSIPSSVLDPRNVEKSSSSNEVSSKDSFRNSRSLCHSRYFCSVRNAACDMKADEDGLSCKIMSDNAHGGDLQSSSILLSQVCHDSKNASAAASEQLSELGDVHQQTADGMVISTSEESGDKEPGYFSRLELIGMCLSHGDDELMGLAIEICHRQLALSQTQTWFVIIKLFVCLVCY